MICRYYHLFSGFSAQIIDIMQIITHIFIIIVRNSEDNMQLDRLDRKILSALVSNGRATQQELGEAAGLSPSAAARRQKALEDDGVLRGYRADVNLARLGYGATVMVTITLEGQSEEAMAAFEAAVTQSPSILRCHLMSGRDDYLLVVKARSLEDYERIHRQELARLPRVARIETAFALREVVNRAVPPSLLA
jgi:Lrp/AsnC family transcriptional regulator, leucine-responsive regulatory protein